MGAGGTGELIWVHPLHLSQVVRRAGSRPCSSIPSPRRPYTSSVLSVATDVARAVFHTPCGWLAPRCRLAKPHPEPARLSAWAAARLVTGEQYDQTQSGHRPECDGSSVEASAIG